jgi:hypothetical protein
MTTTIMLATAPENVKISSAKTTYFVKRPQEEIQLINVL